MGSSSEAFIDMREKEFTINTTFKVSGKDINRIEIYLHKETSLINYKTIINTEEMYKNDPVFKKMLKDEKIRKRAKEDYINKHIHKYK